MRHSRRTANRGRRSEKGDGPRVSLQGHPAGRREEQDESYAPRTDAQAAPRRRGRVSPARRARRPWLSPRGSPDHPVPFDLESGRGSTARRVRRRTPHGEGEDVRARRRGPHRDDGPHAQPRWSERRGEPHSRRSSLARCSSSRGGGSGGAPASARHRAPHGGSHESSAPSPTSFAAALESRLRDSARDGRTASTTRRSTAMW
jgi:hypothetical protein